MCNLYSITANPAAIIALFRVINRYVGNLAPMPGRIPFLTTAANGGQADPSEGNAGDPDYI